MKINYSIAGQDPGLHSAMHLHIGLKSKINLLILVHILLYVLFTGFGQDTTGNLASWLAISSADMQARGWANVFTYHFIHLSKAEFLLSMSMLWLFGNMLQEKLGQRKVILLYFLSVTLSGVVFMLSHLIFPVFSGNHGMLDGSFSGVLTIMTIAVLLYKSHKLRIGRKILLPVWQIYLLVLLISFAMVYKHNMAYILIYACSIYIGFKMMLPESDQEGAEG